MKISSASNPRIKELKKLRDGKYRRRYGKFLIEGKRECLRAKDCGIQIHEAFIKESASVELEAELGSFGLNRSFIVADAIFEKVAMRSVEPLIVIAQTPEQAMDDWSPKKGKAELLICCEGLEKPGNLGAILRTADGIGATGIVLLDSKTDVYNPNCIRASLGAVFSLPIYETTSELFLKFCQKNEIIPFAASPFASTPYFAEDFSRSSALIFGSEAFGLSDFWNDSQDTKKVQIPMRGICDSLNVSVSAAIIGYECLRQRSLTRI
ncbi:MAG: RNA methyltransferase [Pseudobacteriovorax sp.]|nr:RNA methyltransferase [Pseudobacteriovorax sp.]